jgi:signal transduction histidine kinase
MKVYTTEAVAEAAVDLGDKKLIRVLHVDDELDFLNVAKQCLERESRLQVDTALSVEEAMEKMKTVGYDAIVSDYQMPGKDGLEFLKELRHRGDTVPFIIFTGKGREEVAINALNLGADHYLNKTGKAETVYGELLHAISQATDRKSAQERLKDKRLTAVEKELEAATAKLEMMNEKLRVTGGLTRHDVRNKLSIITGNAYLARKELAGNKKVQDYLKEMEIAVQQAVRIFDFAKAYEMLGVEELAYVDVERTVDEAVSLFSDLKGAKVTTDCHGLCVLADSLLMQLFSNLIDNSLKHGRKTTRIRVYYEETGQDELKLVYEDDGVGIPAEEKSKLFKERFSTGGRPGYGLYLIGKTVEVYGWMIQETGTPGKGVQFTIMIPKKDLKNRKTTCQIRRQERQE